MNKPLIALPCTTQELENALHAVCDHDGLWGAEVRLVLKKPEHVWYLEVNAIDVIEGRQKLGRPKTIAEKYAEVRQRKETGKPQTISGNNAEK